MNVEKKEHNDSIPFSTIKQGEVFEFRGKYYMRIEETSDGYNTVCIEDGELDGFAENCRYSIRPIKGRFVEE